MEKNMETKTLERVATGILSFPTEHQQAGPELALGEVVGRMSLFSARIEAKSQSNINSPRMVSYLRASIVHGT